MTDALPDPGAFGAAFEEFIRVMSDAAQLPESQLAQRLREHLGAEPAGLPSTVAEFPTTDHPNLQLALDAVLPEAEIVGFRVPHSGFAPLSLADVVAGRGVTGPIHPGPVQEMAIEVGDGRVVACVAAGMYLARRGDVPVALVLSRSEGHFGRVSLRVEGVSPERETVPALLADLRAAMREHNVYRGQVISLHQREDRGVTVHFHRPPAVARDAVILPDGTLERLERQALGVAREAERLRAEGRHLKRGVLLHGPPGTGKTLSVTYLLGAMPGRTTILLTGRGLGLIEEALVIARELAPATVVFEDVDLVAAERTMHIGAQGVLFELLNQMEGLEEDADLLFVLTTNRPDVIEPALAARPGRIDLALEVPLPDEAARRRLIHLYARDVELDAATEDDLVTRTASVSGAFIKELMRQAALRAALAGDAPATGADVVGALDELLDDRAALTRRLLGQPADGAASDGPTSPPFGPMIHAIEAAGLPLPPGMGSFDVGG
jgi:DNA polymerase III delta prime subunit